MENTLNDEAYVFGLDIGTRSLVGTVGYKKNEKEFTVVAQYTKLHDTRAMLDGQIHDINQVAESIRLVKRELEKKIGRKLEEVCIAAAGRVLKTVVSSAEYDFGSETLITKEHIHSLELMGVEKAYEIIRLESKNEKINFYCVGYSVINYTLNNYKIINLEEHKANAIGAELIATFLPEEVIDGLYSSVEKAGLKVANLTLEPIAAINVAIPEKFRLLNIALIDVGAGTSDICITKDGSITAYGMIPLAGDEITETIAKKYLVEFNVAEKIKMSCLKKKSVTYKDILGISHKLMIEEVKADIDSSIRQITKALADKIIDLNGNKSVSAVFIVGGGGKTPGFLTSLSEYLEIPNERVALRGEEVLREVEFLDEKVKKDPLLVTPIGICLSYYEQRNNFVFVTVNGEVVKIYDNNKLTVMDALIQANYPNEELFPRRGKEITYYINGDRRMVRGELGESATMKLNGKECSLNTPINKNDVIDFTPSTKGLDASLELSKVKDIAKNITFQFNNKEITCPRFSAVNGKLVSPYYTILEGDKIEVLNYYTLEQILEFMDLPFVDGVKINHQLATLTDKVYENFVIEYDEVEEPKNTQTVIEINEKNDVNVTKEIYITVNRDVVCLKNKTSYIFVDILDFYPFDITKGNTTSFVMTVNGLAASFTDEIKDGDIVEMYWKE